MSYRFVEDVSRADVAFEVIHESLEKVFESAGEAVTATQVKDVSSVERKVTRKVELNADNLERLLHDFLQEIIFYKDAELLLFSKYHVQISEEDCHLVAEMEGEELNMENHELLVDVKAVTWHHFSLRKEKDKWTAFVILDV